MVCLHAFVGRIIDELSSCFAQAASELRGSGSAPGRSRAQDAAALPSRAWAAEQLVKVLLQYPSGLSYCVLLTELEAKW
jgi:hypothetical protein